jgi:hypothetical protein
MVDQCWQYQKDIKFRKIMKQLFNYGDLKKEHKDAAIEIAELARQLGQDNLADTIAHKFQLVEPNKFKIEDSIFAQACDQAGFKYWIMGWVAEGEGADAIHYPIVSITEDVRKLDNFITSIAK